MKITNFELRMTNYIHKALTIKHLQTTNSLKILLLEKIYIFFQKNFGSLARVLYFCNPNSRQYMSYCKSEIVIRKLKWSCGRVARQSSAKASTAVRIRSGPPKNAKSTSKGCFFVVYGLLRRLPIDNLNKIVFLLQNLNLDIFKVSDTLRVMTLKGDCA